MVVPYIILGPINCIIIILISPDNFLEVIKKSNETPVKKFQFPQTSAQEIGWNTEPLVSLIKFRDKLETKPNKESAMKLIELWSSAFSSHCF